MDRSRVGIINVTGYAGVELARLLYQHPEVELTSVTGRSMAGQKLGTVFPHLASLNLTIEAELGKVDLAFSAMPHKESAPEVIPLLNRGTKVVDISADFRLKDAAQYPPWYGFTHFLASRPFSPDFRLKYITSSPQIYTSLPSLRPLRIC